jgi:hypothetical protein
LARIGGPGFEGGELRSVEEKDDSVGLAKFGKFAN